MKAIKCLLIAMVSLATFSSCDNGGDTIDVLFLGDAVMAKWDVKTSFPNWSSRNMGAEYAEIKHIGEKAKLYSNCDVVILTGIHDAPVVDRDGSNDAYYNAFIKNVSDVAVGNNNIYVFSLLPRHCSPEPSVEVAMNENVKMISNRIKATAQSLGWIFIDVFDDFAKDGTVNDDLTEDERYRILTSRLLQVYKE